MRFLRIVHETYHRMPHGSLWAFSMAVILASVLSACSTPSKDGMSQSFSAQMPIDGVITFTD